MHHAFSGFEDDWDVPTGIIASEKGGRWAKENLDYYKEKHFVNADGSFDLTSNVKTITKLLLPYGLKRNNTYQDFPGLITLYTKDYFCPKNYISREILLTENTHCIHHFNGSWWTKSQKFRAWLTEVGFGAYEAKIITKVIFFSIHVIQHLLKGTFISQAKKHLQ